jgi:wyosine [tRNA(Phe)-imidazoG37] synthetase (radical SAM superfamily)
MPTPIPLQDSVVYGPIHSRRFGSSLGLNVLPLRRKVCSSNCVYCQYGWTPSSGPSERLKRAPELLREIEQGFERHADGGTKVECLTFAGNGEPTLHPDLETLIVGVKRLRDRHFPGAPVGILSDSTQVTRENIRRALALLDVRCMKLDAADDATWRRINLPLSRRADFGAMVEGLRRLPDVILQSLFLQGSFENVTEPHVARWIELVALIHPCLVQVYTVDRPTAAGGIEAVPRAQLQAIADRLTKTTGIPAETYGDHHDDV